MNGAENLPLERLSRIPAKLHVIRLCIDGASSERLNVYCSAAPKPGTLRRSRCNMRRNASKRNAIGCDEHALQELEIGGGVGGTYTLHSSYWWSNGDVTCYKVENCKTRKLYFLPIAIRTLNSMTAPWSASCGIAECWYDCFFFTDFEPNSAISPTNTIHERIHVSVLWRWLWIVMGCVMGCDGVWSCDPCSALSCVSVHSPCFVFSWDA